MNGQRTQRSGHITRTEKYETDRMALEWKPYVQIPSGRPRKIWIYVVGEDLKTLEVKDEALRSVVMGPITLVAWALLS